MKLSRAKEVADLIEQREQLAIALEHMRHAKAIELRSEYGVGPFGSEMEATIAVTDAIRDAIVSGLSKQIEDIHEDLTVIGVDVDAQPLPEVTRERIAGEYARAGEAVGGETEEMAEHE